jgi:hypothetical protein
MRILLYKLLMILLISGYCFAQNYWMKTEGPKSGVVNPIAINSRGDIFAGAYFSRWGFFNFP